MSDDMKTCSRCGETKPRAAFGRSAGKPDGLRYSCRACDNARGRERDQRPERKAQQKAYRERRGPLPAEQRRIYAARYRARNLALRAAGVPPPPEKRCQRCGETKPADAFGRNRATGDGLDFYCRPCRRAYVNARNAARREVRA